MANAYKKQIDPEQAIDLLFQRGLINSDGTSAFVQTLVNDQIEIDSNAFFWQEHFSIDGVKYNINPSRPKEDPAFVVKNITRRPVPMANPMAPLSEVGQIDNESYEQRSGSIGQFGMGLFETSLSREELKAELAAMAVADQNIITGYIRTVADLIKSHNSNLSNLAAQTLSKGGGYDMVGREGLTPGMTHNFSNYVPRENYKKAGKAVWTDPEADVPSQMMKLEQDFKKEKGLEDTTFEWDLPYDLIVNNLINNKFFKEEVNRYIRLYAPDKVIVVQADGKTGVDVNSITWQQLVEYSRSTISKIAPIRIVKEEQITQGITNIRTVNGWKKGVAVLRPLGLAGKVVHSDTAEVYLLQKEANKTIDFSVATAQGGLLYVINKVVPNGLYKAYHTDIVGRYRPVLTEFMEHVIVDYTTADN